MKQIAKCKGCGRNMEVSREGWLVDSVARKDGKPVIPAKRDVKYFEWIHIPGHMNGKKMCSGSGASPS